MTWCKYFFVSFLITFSLAAFSSEEEINTFYECVISKDVSTQRIGLDTSNPKCNRLFQNSERIFKEINHPEIKESRNLNDGFVLLVCKTPTGACFDFVLYDIFQPIDEIWKKQRQRKVEMKNEQNEKYLHLIRSNSIDSVAKVLNYSSGCDDAGCEGSSPTSWIAEDSKNCKYVNVNKNNGEVLKAINLNTLDPKSIKISQKVVTETIPDPFSGRRTRMIESTFNTQNVEYQGRSIFIAKNLDTGRLQRGWALIYSKYCKGSKKEF